MPTGDSNWQYISRVPPDGKEDAKNPCTIPLEADPAGSSPSCVNVEAKMHALCAVVINHEECHKR